VLSGELELAQRQFVAGRTRALRTAELLDALRAAGVPAAPILSVAAVMEEPQTKASGMLLSVPHPRLSDYRSIGLPIRWDGARPGVRRVPPRLGEHTNDVLTWLGYSSDDARTLTAAGLVQ